MDFVKEVFIRVGKCVYVHMADFLMHLNACLYFFLDLGRLFVHILCVVWIT